MCMFIQSGRCIDPNQRGCYHTINSYKEVLLGSEYLVTPGTPYPHGKIKEDIGGFILSNSWAVNMWKLGIKIPPQCWTKNIVSQMLNNLECAFDVISGNNSR